MGSPREPRQRRQRQRESGEAAAGRRDSCRRRGPRACLGLRRRRKNSLLLGCQPTLVPPFCPSQFFLQVEGEGGRCRQMRGCLRSRGARRFAPRTGERGPREQGTKANLPSSRLGSDAGLHSRVLLSEGNGERQPGSTRLLGFRASKTDFFRLT